MPAERFVGRTSVERCAMNGAYTQILAGINSGMDGYTCFPKEFGSRIGEGGDTGFLLQVMTKDTLIEEANSDMLDN